MAKRWADLTKEERQQQKAQGVTKKDFNRRDFKDLSKDEKQAVRDSGQSKKEFNNRDKTPNKVTKSELRPQVQEASSIKELRNIRDTEGAGQGAQNMVQKEIDKRKADKRAAKNAKSSSQQSTSSSGSNTGTEATSSGYRDTEASTVGKNVSGSNTGTEATSSGARMAGDAVSQSKNKLTETPPSPQTSTPTTQTEPRFAGEVANFDSEKYYGKRTDVSAVYDQQSAAGLAGDGTEAARVNAMNTFYGTDYKDVGDFSKDQFGYWHTQHHADAYESKGQGGDYYQRMAGDAVTEPITPTPTPTSTPVPRPGSIPILLQL